MKVKSMGDHLRDALKSMGGRNDKIALNCWKENIPLLKQICRDNGVTDCDIEEIMTDCDGDTLFEFKADCNWTPESWDYYQKHRIRK